MHGKIKVETPDRPDVYFDTTDEAREYLIQLIANLALTYEIWIPSFRFGLKMTRNNVALHLSAEGTEALRIISNRTMFVKCTKPFNEI